MKRLVCLLMAVTVACAGCQEKYKDPLGVTVEGPTKSKDWQSNQVLRANIAKLETELLQAKDKQKPDKAMLSRIAELEAVLKLQRAVETNDKVLMSRIGELEVVIKLQGAELECSEQMYFLCNTTIEAQAVTIESMVKLCRLYEEALEFERESRSNDDSMRCE